MELEFNTRGVFKNGITAIPVGYRTNISTVIRKSDGLSIRLHEFTNIPWDTMVSLAINDLHSRLHDEDFIINPQGFSVEVPDDWENIEAHSLNTQFYGPKNLRFMPGVRVSLPQVPKFGNFKSESPAALIFASNELRWKAKIELTDREYLLSLWGQDPQICNKLQLQNKLKELVSKHDRKEFHEARKQYIEQLLLDSFFSIK